MRVLLLGAGSSRDKRIRIREDEPQDWSDDQIVTLDCNGSHHPDVVFDLESGPWPFDSDSFDRVDAYEILEHLGQQGDPITFFRDFGQAWRVLKAGGHLCATVPLWSSMWAWGDPSHKRVINRGSLVFLCQPEYRKQKGHTAMSDLRHLWFRDFDIIAAEETGESFAFVLQAVKPARL